MNGCRAQVNYCPDFAERAKAERMLSNRRSLFINLGVVFVVVVVLFVVVVVLFVVVVVLFVVVVVRT